MPSLARERQIQRQFLIRILSVLHEVMDLCFGPTIMSMTGGERHSGHCVLLGTKNFVRELHPLGTSGSGSEWGGS